MGENTRQQGSDASVSLGRREQIPVCGGQGRAVPADQAQAGDDCEGRDADGSHSEAVGTTFAGGAPSEGDAKTGYREVQAAKGFGNERQGHPCAQAQVTAAPKVPRGETREQGGEDVEVKGKGRRLPAPWVESQHQGGCSEEGAGGPAECGLLARQVVTDPEQRYRLRRYQASVLGQ